MMETTEEFSLSGAALTEILQTGTAKDVSFRFKVKGFSMTPFIRDGDVLTISPWVKGLDGLGRVVAFVHSVNGGLAIHRIVGRKMGNYLIKGDGIFGIDGLVPEKNILGMVTKIERNKRVILFGLGPERILIAFLSRVRFISLILWIWRLAPIPMRSFIKCRLLS